MHATNAQITGDTVAESATVETTFGGVDLRDVKGGARVTAGNSSIRLTGIGGEAYAKTTFNGMTISRCRGPGHGGKPERLGDRRRAARRQMPADFPAHDIRPDSRDRAIGAPGTTSRHGHRSAGSTPTPKSRSQATSPPTR